MKKIFAIFTSIFILSLFTGCDDNTIDDLTGKYPPPGNYTFTQVVEQSAQKQGNLRIFTIKLADNAGQSISIDFVGNKYYLEPGNYSVIPLSAAANGKLIAGYSEGSELKGTHWATVGNALAVTGGSLTVQKNNDNYTFNGILLLSDETAVKVAFAGEIVYEPDPYVPTYTYTVEVQKPYAWTMDGMNYTPVPGSQLNKISVFADGEQLAYFEIVTEENAASLGGTYSVKAVNSLERAIVQGQYMNLLWLGMFDMVIEAGTWVIDSEKLFVRDGNVTITDNDGTLTFVSSDLGLQDVSTQMAFGVLPTPGSINYANMTLAGGGGAPTPTTGVISWTGGNQEDYHNSGWTLSIIDDSGFELSILVLEEYDATFHSAAGNTYSLTSDFQNKTIAAPLSTYTKEGLYGFSTGSLTFKTVDANTINLSGVITVGTQTGGGFGPVENPFEVTINGNYTNN